MSIRGKVLRVNLTTNDLKVEELNEKVYRRYLGGRSLALYFLLKELEPKVDPLGPENRLVFVPTVTRDAAAIATILGSVTLQGFYSSYFVHP